RTVAVGTQTTSTAGLDPISSACQYSQGSPACQPKSLALAVKRRLGIFDHVYRRGLDCEPHRAAGWELLAQRGRPGGDLGRADTQDVLERGAVKHVALDRGLPAVRTAAGHSGESPA